MFISLLLALVVVVGLLLAYLGSAISSRQQRAQVEMTQDAQFALTLMARDLQMAGYVEPASIAVGAITPRVAFRPVFGCNDGFDDGNAEFSSATCAPAPAAGTASPGPSLEVNYQATPDVALVQTGNLPVDCKGVGVNPDAASNLYLVSNRYYVETPTGTSAVPALYCGSNAGTAGSRSDAPLIDQVEALSVAYGVAPGWTATDPTTWRPAYYVDATAVGANWPQVVAVRLCVLMRSREKVLTSEDDTTYQDCTGSAMTSTDRRMRRAFVSTVALRNKVN